MPSLKFLIKIIDKNQPSYKIDHNAYQKYIKEVRGWRKENGLCLWCYCPRAAGDDWFCGKHRDRRRAWDLQRLHKRKKLNKCRRCDKPRSVTNKSYCKDHAKIEAAWHRKRRKKIKLSKKRALSSIGQST